jgi:hypothetical protein
MQVCCLGLLFAHGPSRPKAFSKKMFYKVEGGFNSNTE